MEITLNVNRLLRQDSIIEIFTWSPSFRCTNDMTSNVYKQLRYEINKNSLGSILQLIDIDYLDNKKIYTYQKPEVLPDVKLSFSNVYNIKNCATKTCKTCHYYLSHLDVCTFRAKEKPKYYKCQDWTEREQTCILLKTTK